MPNSYCMNLKSLKPLLVVLALASCKSDEESSSEPAGATEVASGMIQPTGGATTTPRPSSADIAAVEAVKASLSFADFAGTNTDTSLIGTDLIFPTEKDGLALAWTTDTPGAIAVTGQVVRPPFGSPAITVVIGVTVVKGLATAGRTFTLIVTPLDPTDLQAVDAAKDELTDGAILGSNDSLNRLTVALQLGTSANYGVSVAWSDSLAQLNAATGAVARPAVTASSVSGTLTATLSRGSAQTTKTFNVRVLREFPALMITEIYPGFDAHPITGTSEPTGFVEIMNTTSANIVLSSYTLARCSLTDDCTGAPVGGAMPNFTLGPGKHVLLVYGDTATDTQGLYGNTSTVVQTTTVQLLPKNGMVEIRSGGTTVDFVRYRDPTYTSGTAVERTPATGTYTTTVPLTSAASGTSIGRTFPYEDSDGGADWVVFSQSSPGYANHASATALDSDGDGLTDAYEQSVTLTDPQKRDTDGDWFTDAQEVLDSGVYGVNLKALGANPLVRDIFVEVDWMASPLGAGNSLTDSTTSAFSLPLRKAALDKVVAAFDAYTPDANDGGAKKIKIHFDAGANFAGHDLGGGNQIPFARCVYLGTDSLDADNVTRNGTNCHNLYDIKLANFDAARRYIFHYMLVGWSQDTDGAPGSSGVAELLGNDLILSLGAYGTLPEAMLINFQAATILHELGHNLGLLHGGHDDLNYKPNYMSSMNYLYQLEGLDLANDGKIFYTKVDHPQRKLNGTQINTNRAAPSFAIGFSNGNRLQLVETALNEATGWAGAGFPIDFDLDNATDVSPVAVNINGNLAATDTLDDHDDWKNLRVRFQESAAVERNGANPFQLTGPADDDRQPLARPCTSHATTPP